ncbi:MAG: molybdopterin-dependent oxidoreductase [Frankiales bacterium]|nr:molybdopterin-dependent oxidoreductase [Frankiales bacterium]
MRHGPGGPFNPGSWRSPLRGPWLTSALALVLLVGLLVVIVTGLLSYAAYDPRFGGSNEQTPARGLLGFYLFSWPTSPAWLYRVNQGTHVLLGIALIPVVLAKLWSVAPKLFEWPPVSSPAKALERLSLLLIVGGILFLIVTGVMNIQYDYAWGFSFYTGHFYAAWVFIAGFAAHVALKLPLMIRSLRNRSFIAEMQVSTSDTVAEAPDPDHLVSPNPAPATMSRRGMLAVVGGGSLGLLALSIGQSVDPLRPTALLSPRGQSYGDGPNDFQVNVTFADAQIMPAETGAAAWRLQLIGPTGRTATLRREELLTMAMATEELPIACVEGWSTSQRWTGVRLSDLAALVDGQNADSVFVESLQKGGAFSTHTLSGAQIRARRSLLALKVNGVDLSLDHGFPARMIIPAAPGVRNTKWVRTLTFGATS